MKPTKAGGNGGHRVAVRQPANSAMVEPARITQRRNAAMPRRRRGRMELPTAAQKILLSCASPRPCAFALIPDCRDWVEPLRCSGGFANRFRGLRSRGSLHPRLLTFGPAGAFERTCSLCAKRFRSKPSRCTLRAAALRFRCSRRQSWQWIAIASISPPCSSYHRCCCRAVQTSVLPHSLQVNVRSCQKSGMRGIAQREVILDLTTGTARPCRTS